MLSILLPIYNTDVRELVQALVAQCTDLSMEYEVIALDDASTDTFLVNQNKWIRQFDHVEYTILAQNIGRAAIRNELARRATFSYLLFLDSDIAITSSQFIQNYVSKLPTDKVLVGGCHYQKQPPENMELYLRWHFGVKREQLPAIIRQQQPYHAFMTANFLMPKRYFEKVQFDHTIKIYGHEDTLFGLSLKDHKIKIKHLDNAVEHIGLETAATFLKKTNQACQNIVLLRRQYPFFETKLSNAAKLLEEWQIMRVFLYFFRIFEPILRRLLIRHRCPLWCLDIYKLGVYGKALKKAN